MNASRRCGVETLGMKNALAISLLCLAGFSFASPLPEESDLLASNTVVAEYLDTVHQPCRFRTALCPDRCDHAADIARFRVLENKDYRRPGQYGDDKAEKDTVLMVDATRDIPGQDDADIHKKLAELKPGDKVEMTIAHYYVQDKGSHYPTRPVRKLVRVDTEQEGSSPPQIGSSATPSRRNSHRQSDTSTSESTRITPAALTYRRGVFSTLPRLVLTRSF